MQQEAQQPQQATGGPARRHWPPPRRSTVSRVSFWAVVALVVGAALAATGRRVGAPRDGDLCYGR